MCDDIDFRAALCNGCSALFLYCATNEFPLHSPVDLFHFVVLIFEFANNDIHIYHMRYESYPIFFFFFEMPLKKFKFVENVLLYPL